MFPKNKVLNLKNNKYKSQKIIPMQIFKKYKKKIKDQKVKKRA
jgi:hypothetical protein